jgi:hypothetical protein
MDHYQARKEVVDLYVMIDVLNSRDGGVCRERRRLIRGKLVPDWRLRQQ